MNEQELWDKFMSAAQEAWIGWWHHSKRGTTPLEKFITDNIDFKVLFEWTTTCRSKPTECYTRYPEPAWEVLLKLEDDEGLIFDKLCDLCPEYNVIKLVYI